MIEAEAEGICAGDEGIGWELKSEGDGGEGSADAAERLGGFGDGDGVVREREPGRGVHLDDSLLRITEVVDLEGERSGGLALCGREGEGNGEGSAVVAEDFDGELDARSGFLSGREGEE